MQLTSGDSRGRATLNDLKVALSKAGLRAAAHSLSITVPHHTPSKSTESHFEHVTISGTIRHIANFTKIMICI